MIISALFSSHSQAFLLSLAHILKHTLVEVKSFDEICRIIGY